MRLALFQPDIPQNVGAAIRLSACLGVELDIIEPCGFPLGDRGLRRAALDYGPLARVDRHADFAGFSSGAAAAGRRLVLLTTQSPVRLYDFAFDPDDILLVGRESAGAPDEVHTAVQARIRIPLAPCARSMNVVTAAAIALGEALRQTAAGPV